MIRVFLLHDRPHSAGPRQRLRPGHRACPAQSAARLVLAGPLPAEDGGTMTGSLPAIDFASRAGAPFTRAGRYAPGAVRPFQNPGPQQAGFAPAP